MAATRGPIPKRSDQRRRRNQDEPITTITPGDGPVDAPPLGFPAHALAADWYAALAESGQALYFEPSDWAAARILAYDLTRHLNSGRVSAQMLAAVWSGMADLLTTEAARRRVRMEIERAADDGPDAGVVALDDYRRALGAG
ncbi:hypothetical protein [Longispora albida]|uniref:phage terminase small subunit n=1 Tax=Longispora albida TaxID=203523 RepID=UPI00058E067B|nr:hypothetical protein [Longispora albida]